ncbi:MAG: AAA family ATPase [Alphaproteobacteria bacterium]|nr:AAA family ATPase [Alphaproteobacteria bacterium]MBU2083766.1 AAA family ATPase [Alphaproteobacteria bacterium]MBU2142552.1 AAA family ATPase [Alphaproteobacteria bacterium]MBU2197695.1 AAA family ATPase [Alphaproteobacteria bacterium]
MTKSEKPKTVLETILAWSEIRPLWQRDAVRRIVLNGSPDSKDIDEILALCKKEHGDQTISAEAIPLLREHLPVDPGEGESIGLASLRDVVGVNQLAVGQELNFARTGITVIYGPNGTGKSGYSRILKKACRARHAGEIMPDVSRPSPTGNATAMLTIAKADGSTLTINWEDNDRPAPVLSAITVFDRDCASVHIKKKNEVWFRPFGLDIPDDLANVCHSVKERLSAEREQLVAKRHSVFDTPTWNAETKVGSIMGGLSAKTNLDSLRELVGLTSEEQLRLNTLRSDLSQSPEKAASEQNRKANKIESLVEQISRITDQYSDERLKIIYQANQASIAARQAAELAASAAFGDLQVGGVGAALWRLMWTAARNYSRRLGESGIPFPPREGENCVLCHQEVTRSTSIKLASFEEFVQMDAERLAREAEEETNSLITNFRLFNAVPRLRIEARDILDPISPALAKSVRRFFASAKLRRRKFLMCLLENEPFSATLMCDPRIEELQIQVDSHRNYALALSAGNNQEGRRILEQELAELSDRSQAEALLEIAEVEIERLVLQDRFDACLAETATAAITRLGNSIADELITPRMQDKFQEEIVSLAGSRVRVKIDRSGGKFGSPQYEVKLFANPKAKVHDVLSEGEQTCVALAAYLTELSNATHKSALVFDDPVTSLDHMWRKSVAKRLIKEAAERQVIVFTHDLIFVNDLKQMANDGDIPVGLAHLRRGIQGVGIVNESLPWEAASMRSRIDGLEKAARAAQKLHDTMDDFAYRSAAYDFYSKLRSTWERGLEDVLFSGVVLRHRDYINTKGLHRVAALNSDDVKAVERGFGKCSDYIDAHDPSRGRDGAPPDPAELFADLASLEIWERDLRVRQNELSNDRKPGAAKVVPA